MFESAPTQVELIICAGSGLAGYWRIGSGDYVADFMMQAVKQPKSLLTFTGSPFSRQLKRGCCLRGHYIAHACGYGTTIIGLIFCHPE